MVKLRKLAHKVIDSVSDRFDHVVAALDDDVRTPVIPESIRELGRGATADILGDLIVVEGFDDGGLTERDFSHTGVPLLHTFFFQYTNPDHHIAMITIDPDTLPGQIRLAYQDENGDDDYFFKTAHRIVDNPRVQRFTRSTDICSEETCTVSLSKPVGDFVFVLIGFSFRFTGNRDNHIKRVRILESDGNLEVQFRDRHSSPPPIFLWDVQFAYVPQDLFATLGSSSGNGDRGGARRDIPAGPKVIRGFSFNFEHDDHHLRDIGVAMQDVRSDGVGRVEVFYEDENGDDPFDWVVDWGILTA
jgi:hypothetical protein